MDNRLISGIKGIQEHITKKDYDCVYLIDGAEGSGKSVFAMQIGKAIDPTLTLDRVCFQPDEFVKAVQNSQKGQVIIYDEAYTGLSSRQSLSQINKLIVSLMMEMRAKNLVCIIVLPTFFMLDRYVAIFRSKGLFHVYTNKGRRGYFLYYDGKEKKTLYIVGKKLMSYGRPRVNFKGNFYGKYVLDEEAYRKKKDDALKFREGEKKKNEEPVISIRDEKRTKQLVSLVMYLHDFQKLSFNAISKILATYDANMNHDTAADLYKRGLQMRELAAIAL